MEDKQKIVLKTIMVEMENHWKKCEQEKREEAVKELSLPVKKERKNLLYRLVRAKKGKMDEEGIDDYLRDYFGIYNLDNVTREEVEEAINYLSKLPNKK